MYENKNDVIPKSIFIDYSYKYLDITSRLLLSFIKIQPIVTKIKSKKGEIARTDRQIKCERSLSHPDCYDETHNKPYLEKICKKIMPLHIDDD